MKVLVPAGSAALTQLQLPGFQKSHFQVPAVFLRDADCWLWFPGGAPAQINCQLPTAQPCYQSFYPCSANCCSASVMFLSSPPSCTVVTGFTMCRPDASATQYKNPSSILPRLSSHQLSLSRSSAIITSVLGTVLPGMLLLGHAGTRKVTTQGKVVHNTRSLH
jgi:hypothetical protein